MAIAIGGSFKLNLDRRMGIHHATTRYLRQLYLPRVPFSCHCSLSSSSSPSSSQHFTNQLPLLQQEEEEEEEEQGVMCEKCKGMGWLLCDFCQGQKTNIQTKNNRTYRRCPTCKAVGYVLCAKCKVYKCVTFPDFFDDVTQL